MGVLREARLIERRKLREVAEHCGVDIRSVQYWESNDYIPTTKHAVAISQYLNIPVEELANDKTDKTYSKPEDKIESQ